MSHHQYDITSLQSSSIILIVNSRFKHSSNSPFQAYYFSLKDSIKLHSLVKAKLIIEKFEAAGGEESKVWNLARKDKQDKKHKCEKFDINNNDEHNMLSPTKEKAKVFKVEIVSSTDYKHIE